MAVINLLNDASGKTVFSSTISSSFDASLAVLNCWNSILPSFINATAALPGKLFSKRDATYRSKPSLSLAIGSNHNPSRDAKKTKTAQPNTGITILVMRINHFMLVVPHRIKSNKMPRVRALSMRSIFFSPTTR